MEVNKGCTVFLGTGTGKALPPRERSTVTVDVDVLETVKQLCLWEWV